MPIIIYYPKEFEVRTSLEGWTSCCKNYIHGLCFFQSWQKAELSSRDARGREVSWLLTGSSLDREKIVSEKTFQGWKKWSPAAGFSGTGRWVGSSLAPLLKPGQAWLRGHLVRKIRSLHPQHLDGIWIGQDQYRLPLAPLNEFPEPWCWKISGRELFNFSGLKVPDIGEKWLKNKQIPRISWTRIFFTTGRKQSPRNSWSHFSPMSGTQTTKNDNFSL